MIRFLRLIARLLICIPMIINLPFELANIFIEGIINILDFSIDKLVEFYDKYIDKDSVKYK